MDELRNVKFDPIEEHKRRDWRAVKPGDLVWYVPDPDDNGCVNVDSIKLINVVNPDPTDLDNDMVYGVRGVKIKLNRRNLYLAEDPDGATKALLQKKLERSDG